MYSSTFVIIYAFVTAYIFILALLIVIEGKEKAMAIFKMITFVFGGLILMWILMGPLPSFLIEQGQQYELIVEDNKGNGGGY